MEWGKKKGEIRTYTIKGDYMEQVFNSGFFKFATFD
jgi:hypothetical protein